MQVSGRLIILTMFGIALALSGGAWWYHYSTTRRAAEFWGTEGARLLVKAPEVEFLELGPDIGGGQTVAGRGVIARQDIGGKPGLLHLRSFALTQDAHFDWDGLKLVRMVDAPDWKYAMCFVEGEQKLVVLMRKDFQEIGKVEGERIWVLPSGRIASSVGTYLRDVGVLERESADAKPQAAGR